jgi:predicted RNase H-like HicB family nuclease
MLTAYIQAAMRNAKYEGLPEDNIYYGEIPELPGVWATNASRDDLPAALQDVLEWWIALGLALHHPISAIDGHTISVALAS